MKSFFLDLLSLGILSHIIMIQNQQEFEIQTYNVLGIVRIPNALFIQTM
jgi:hypothetical protein